MTQTDWRLAWWLPTPTSIRWRPQQNKKAGTTSARKQISRHPISGKTLPQRSFGLDFIQSRHSASLFWSPGLTFSAAGETPSTARSNVHGTRNPKPTFATFLSNNKHGEVTTTSKSHRDLHTSAREFCRNPTRRSSLTQPRHFTHATKTTQDKEQSNNPTIQLRPHRNHEGIRTKVHRD